MPIASRFTAASVLLLLAGCDRTVRAPAPPRVETPVGAPAETSTIVVPVSASLDDLQRALDRETPKQLWRIDQQVAKCVPAQRVDLGIGRVKLVPDLGCRIVGQVVRGPIRLGGSGDRLTIAMPVQATIAARNVGGLVSKTATGAAMIHAVARLSIAGDWRPVAKVSIDYDWTTPPGIDLLGQRIAFVQKADARLRPVVAKLEQSLPGQLAKLRLRDRLADVWRQGFTSIELNRDKPPAWMRVTPRRLGFGGYRVAGRRIDLVLAAEAATETFVGDRPADPTPTPLPPPSHTPAQPGLRFFIPVLADYAQLEPVVKRTLEKRARKGIVLAGIGAVDAKFGKVTVYATTANHLAIGVEAQVKAHNHGMLATKGEIWLTAVPFNAPDTQLVQVRDVQLASRTDSSIANLLVAFFNDTAVRESIRQGLTHDFAPDYQRVLAAARKAVAARRQGDFLLSAEVMHVENGTLQATGQGLFLPLRATGVAHIAYRPR